MGDLLTNILTTEEARERQAVKRALMQRAEIAGPWFDAAAQ